MEWSVRPEQSSPIKAHLAWKPDYIQGGINYDHSTQHVSSKHKQAVSYHIKRTGKIN
jgi:hypothetical protein